jgi:hypothetical protein
VKLPRLKRGAPAAPRRRRTPRPDGPRTIIPGVEDLGAGARPSWLPDSAPVAGTPIQLDLDAARERLRRDIPPVSDEDL